MWETTCYKQVGRGLAHRWRSLGWWRHTTKNCQTVLHLPCRRHWLAGSFQSSKARLKLFLWGEYYNAFCLEKIYCYCICHLKSKRQLLKKKKKNVLGTESSFSFWSLSAIAWSSLLRPLVGTWPALLFLLLPCARDCVDCPCCLASNAATRLWKKHEL